MDSVEEDVSMERLARIFLKKVVGKLETATGQNGFRR